jgi:hypothetical protein
LLILEGSSRLSGDDMHGCVLNQQILHRSSGKSFWKKFKAKNPSDVKEERQNREVS